ncbi:MAG: Gfo/Idh/MocA family oxidoreductase, partial [Pseudomonadota bacterium]
MLQIGLLGAGRIGKLHAQTIASHAKTRLAAVADIYEPAAAALASRYDAMCKDSDEIINDRTIDAVVIASSTDTHADFIEQACQAGKAVFCEKPVALDLGRARSCQRAVLGMDQSIMIGFNRRFDPNFSALK